MGIPKVIHQTWKNKVIPDHFREAVNSWKNLHQDWRFILWTDEMNIEFIETHYPDFLNTYNGYSNNIQRVDAVRYFILLKYGGVYVDLDFHCFKNISPIIEKANCVFGLEHKSHSSLFEKKKIISNAIMASKPEAKFMKLLCAELYDSSVSDFEDKNKLVLETTGPFMLTRVYDRHCNDTSLNVKIMEAKYLYPLPKEKINEQFIEHIKSEHPFTKELNDAYAMHYYWGSWWN